MITPIRLTTTGSPTHGGRLIVVDDLSLDLNHLGVGFGTILSNLHRKKILIGRDAGIPSDDETAIKSIKIQFCLLVNQMQTSYRTPSIF